MHQIKRCKAPCVGFVTTEEYAADVRQAEMFLRGRHSEVIEDLAAEMQTAAEAMQFETAAALRDRIRALQAVLHRQYVSSTQDADVDILAVHAAGEDLCVNLAMVRGGLHLGDRAFSRSQAPPASRPAKRSPPSWNSITSIIRRRRASSPASK